LEEETLCRTGENQGHQKVSNAAKHQGVAIAKPLKNLLRKDVQFKIGLDEQQAVDILKNALVLGLYRRDAKTEIHTDASKDGFAATLLQWHEGQLHPVLCWSKKSSESDARQKPKLFFSHARNFVSTYSVPTSSL